MKDNSVIESFNTFLYRMEAHSFNSFFSCMTDLNLHKQQCDKEYYISLYSAFLESNFDSVGEFLKSFFNLK